MFPSRWRNLREEKNPFNNWFLISGECERRDKGIECCWVEERIPWGCSGRKGWCHVGKTTFLLFPRSCYLGWRAHNYLGFGREPWWSFWNRKQLQHVEYLKPRLFSSSLCLATQDALWAFNITTKPAVLSVELFVGRHLHIKVLLLSSHNSFFFFFFSIILCQPCQDKIKIRRSDGTWEQKYSFSAVHAI